MNRDSPLPMYFQVALDLRRRIGDGEWEPGARIPPEVDLGEEYGVSRVTVRQALAELDKDGLVDRRRGSGTYVCESQQPLVRDVRLGDGEIAATVGESVRADVMDVGVIDSPPAEIRHHLQLRPDDAALYLVRRIICNGQSASLARSWFNAEIVPGIEHSPKLSGSLPQLLAEEYGLKPVRAENQIEVVRSTPEEAALLDSAVDIPFVVVTTTSYLPDGRPLEFSQTEWLSDRVRFQVTSYADRDDGPSLPDPPRR
jgi:DNA-binding GntR family transcriptional regulator